MRRKVATMRKPALMLPRKVSCDFGFSGETAAVRHGHFEYSQLGARGPHLHLEVPAIGHFAHAELLQSVGADRSECAHVGEAHSGRQTRSRRLSRGRPAPDGSPCYPAHVRPGCATRSRNRVRRRRWVEREAGSPRVDRRHRHREKREFPLRLGAPRPRRSRRRGRSRALVRPAPLLRRRAPPATVLSRLPPSTTMISSTQARGTRRDDRTNRALLVEYRDNRGDARPRLVVHKLQRTPHEAQAGGGVSLNSARRNSR